MFVKGKKIEKSVEKGEKDVDIREGGVVLYSSARKTGPRERDREGAGILKTIQRRERNDS